MKKLIFSLLAFVYVVLVILNLFNTRDWHYFLGIDDGSIVVKSNMVPDDDWGKIKTPSGPLIHVTHVNPSNPEQLIINGNGNENYLSLDHGLSWSKIEINEYCCLKLAVWVNHTILVSNGETFMTSKDFGASWNHVVIDTNSSEPIMIPELNDKQELTWTPIPLSNLEEKTLSNTVLSLNAEAKPILQFSDASKYYFELNNNVLHIKDKYIDTGDSAPKIYRDNIHFSDGYISAVLTASSDGLWAATIGGVFFQKHGDSEWQDKSPSLVANSFIGSFEAQQGNKLLILDQIGRLAISEDRGKSWRPMVNHVEKAAFLNDESIVIVQQSGRVLLIDKDDTIEITPNWKLINNESTETTPVLNNQSIYFIHGGKDSISLTSGPPVYLPKNPITLSHYEAIKQSSGRIQEVDVYQYNRNTKQWTVAPWSSIHENEQAAEQRCELSLNYDNIVAINGNRTSDYGTAEKVMLIDDGSAYAHFNDSEVHVRELKNCEPTGLKSVWDFDKIIRPAAYYETDDSLEVIALSHSNTIERLTINYKDTPPLWRRFCYFFYYQYGIYIIGIGLISWFLYLRRKKPAL